MTVLIIIIHVLVNALFGLMILKLFKVNLNAAIKIPIVIITGSFIETLLAFCFLTLNIYEFIAFYITAISSILFWLYIFIKHKNDFNLKYFLKRPNLKWIELIFIIPILIKVFLALFNTIKFPLYFDDAMNHWSGRARALYGHVNWSLDSTSPFFLGKQFGYEEYPLFLVIWRSITAHLNGGWNDVIAKADSWIFYVLIILSVYAMIMKLTHVKWAAIAGAFMVSAVPLMWYHSFSGYSEIAITLLIILIAYTLLNNNIIIAALLTACAIWTKNEGLFIILPTFASCLLLYTFLRSKYNIKATIINPIMYLLYALLFISPWLIFKKINAVAWTVPLRPENYYHEGSIEMFLEMLFKNSTSSILWIMLVIFIVVGSLKWIKSPESIFLITFLFLSMTLFIYVFCFTRSNIFLVNQMTIHRSLLQIAPLAIVLITQVCFLDMKILRTKSET